jgi:hypothetical protein
MMLGEAGDMQPTKPAARPRTLSFDEAKQARTSLSFQDFWGLGYRSLLPVVPPNAPIAPTSSLHKAVGTPKDSRGKAVGYRGRDGLWRSFDWSPYEADEGDIRRWQISGAGVGLKCGSGLVAIDCDASDAKLALLIEEKVKKYFVSAPARYGNRPKVLFLVRVTEPICYMRVDFGALNEKGRPKERVELLSTGKQVVVSGMHPRTGKPYEWPGGVPAYDKLPVCTPEHLKSFLNELRNELPNAAPVVTEGSATGATVDQETLRGEIELVRKAVSLIPNSGNDFASRENYLAVGYAIKAALPDDPETAFELFSSWCDRWTEGENDPEVVEADWRRMCGPFKRGANWLYELAEKYVPTKFSRAEAFFEPIKDIEPSAFDIAAKRETVADVKVFELVTLHEAADTALEHSNKPLVKGLLDQGTLSVCYGESNVGKTFVAMDIAFSIATGLPWGGMKSTKMGVVYIAAEGGAGARKRSKALSIEFGNTSVDAPFYLLLSSVDLFHADADLRPLIQTIKKLEAEKSLEVGLVVVDTFSRAMAGGDENTPGDMGRMIMQLDALRAETGAHVMVVHHTGKDKARGARGHSSLRAATDTEIEISEGQITVQKQRDLDKTYAANFVLDVHKLGNDVDGDPVTSCTVRLVAKGEAREKPTPSETIVLDALDDATPLGSLQGVGPRDILPLARKGGLDTDEDGVRAHLKNLKKKGLVCQLGRGKWAATVAPSAPSEFFSEIVEQSEEKTAQEPTGMERGTGVFQ